MSDTNTAVRVRDTEPLSVRLRDVGFWADWAAVVGLIALVIVFFIATPAFLTVGNVEAMMVAAAILVVLAVGQTFVVATAGIDLSVASPMTLGAVMLGWASAHGWNIAAACLLAILASGAVGVINGLLVAKGRITDFIVTLGTLSAASGAALVISDGKPVQVPSTFLLRLASGKIGPFCYSVLVAAVVAVVAHVVLFRTRFGVHLLATGGDRESARAMGVNTDGMKIAVYTISGVLAGLAAILLVARVGAAEPAANTAFLLNSVAAVVLGGVSLFGGRGTIIGPVVGALLLTALVNGLTILGVSQFYQPVAVGIVVVLAALLTRFQR
jgi:ribose transport system permease protein